jgi:ATP-dependent Clp protease ATP-binding subunit ClpB
VVNFKNVIIVMTSNLGSELILEAKKPETIKDALLNLLKQSFRPEFLNRIDETVIFNRLGKNEINKIVDIQLEYLSKRLAERKITLKLTKAARDLIAERGYDPQFGARPLKRTIQSDLENPLAKAIIAGKIKEGDTISADCPEKGEEALVFKKVKN